MTPEQIEQIIEMLAEKLGPIGGQVWAIYVRQVYVDAIGSAIWMLAFLTAALMSVCWLRRSILARRDNGRTEVSDQEISSIVVLLLCLTLALLAFTSGVLQIVNPGYHAIQMLLGR